MSQSERKNNYSQTENYQEVQLCPYLAVLLCVEFVLGESFTERSCLVRLEVRLDIVGVLLDHPGPGLAPGGQTIALSVMAAREGRVVSGAVIALDVALVTNLSSLLLLLVLVLLMVLRRLLLLLVVMMRGVHGQHGVEGGVVVVGRSHRLDLSPGLARGCDGYWSGLAVLLAGGRRTWSGALTSS